MIAHERVIARPRLSKVIDGVYIPKFKAKAFASYLYAGENADNYNDFSIYQSKNAIFGNKERSKDEVILGIESSFDDSAASLINSYGNIVSNAKIS